MKYRCRDSELFN